MASTVVLTEDAERDLEDIYRFVAIHGSLNNADHVLAELEATIAKLAELPERGNGARELQSLGISEYREIHWKPCRVIYRVVGREVIVYCIAGGRRDMQSLLQRRLFS